jgi:hypothetical protein
MTFVAVKDLKRTKELWRKLEENRELIITCEGQPRALMVPVTAENLEDRLREVRWARFDEVLSDVRERAKKNPITNKRINEVIQASRRERRSSQSRR